MSLSASLKSAGSLASVAPALLGAASFACGDVLSRVAFASGAGVLTIVTVRGFVGLALLYAWLRLGAMPAALSPRQRWLALGVGLLFAGNVFFLFKAFEAVAVPIAILTYFVYPLVTGIAAAAFRLESLTLRGLAAALVALLGLALMLGANPTALAASGIMAALAAALCRVVMLLVTRASLQGADPRLITWYSLVSSTALLTVASLATVEWQPPQTTFGWIVLMALSIAVTAGILGVYASTARIGPFRTALFMNLEPLLATIGSALFLGELITPLQALGGAVMIAALVAFQARR